MWGSRFDLQFEEGKVGVAVVGAVFTLLRHIVLENGGGFGVVAVETIKDSFNMLGAIRRVVEGYAHGQSAWYLLERKQQ